MQESPVLRGKLHTDEIPAGVYPCECRGRNDNIPTMLGGN